MDVKDAPRYTSKAFRRWVAQELLQHGSTIAVVKSSGAWSGSGYGSYIDLEFDKAQKISKVLTDHLSDDSSSGEEESNPPRKRGRGKEETPQASNRPESQASNRYIDTSSPPVKGTTTCYLANYHLSLSPNLATFSNYGDPVLVRLNRRTRRRIYEKQHFQLMAISPATWKLRLRTSEISY